MGKQTFQAMVVREEKDGKFTRKIEEKSIDDLPDNDVLVKVMYSSVNFKDLLSATGNRGVTKSYPHTPGIDAAGVVKESASADFKAGDKVIVTSYDLGMNTPGGFGQFIRVPSEWVVKLPEKMTLRESMIYGTAGFTAGLSVLKLVQAGVARDSGPILVSGATGGVGSISVSILSKLGYQVTAINGIKDESGYLKQLGATDIISIEDATGPSKKPLLKGLWAGGIDTVGGDILATTIKSIKLDGVVTCCGNAASHDLPINVYPFILRGASLLGIDSQNCSMPPRKMVWEKLATDWRLDHLDNLTTEISLFELDERIEMMLERKHRGRTLLVLP